MKKNIYILIACLFTAMLAGCSVNEEGIYGSFPYLEIDQTSVTLSKVGSTEALTYESNRALRVTVESKFGKWLTAIAQDGEIILTYQNNELETKRTAQLIITTPNQLITKTIDVTQDASGELTFEGDLKLKSKSEIKDNTYTKVRGELIVGNVTSVKAQTKAADVNAECGDRTLVASHTDIDDSDMDLLTEQIHLVEDRRLSVVNTEITEFPMDLIKNNGILRLYLPYNKISELPSAEVMESLELYELSVEGNKIKDISNLQDCRFISYLNIAENDIHDLSPILGMSSLNKVVLTGLPLSKPQLDVFKEKWNKEIVAENIRENDAPIPIINNIEIEELDENTVRLTAKVERNGGNNLTDYGFYIGTSRNINDMYFQDGSISTDGTITLEYQAETLVGKVYHVRAAAKNSYGEGYSNASSFGTRISYEDIKLMWESDFEDFYNNSYSHIYGSLYVGYMSVYDSEGIYFKNETEEFYFSRMSDFSSMEFTNLSRLSGLVHVSEGIYIGNTDITNIDHITHVTGMHTLYLKGNKLTTIPELECAGTLKSLDVSRNALTSFSFLDKLPELEKLYLGDSNQPSKETNDIGILEGLETYTNIKHLDLSGLPLHQFQIDDLKKLMPETEIVFKSGGRNPHLPTVSAGSFEKGDEKVTLKGYVVNKGKSDIIEHGFYFGKDKDNLEKIKVGDEIGENETFTLEQSISDEDFYYFYPYAVNSLGETRTSPVQFSLAFDDLCEFGTANSYIVTAAGRYRFNATVKGFSSEQIHPSSVVVLWETEHTYVPEVKGSIIESIELVGGEVEFETTGQEGNALIAVKDDAGEILWSWHIWATDQPAIHEYKNAYGSFYLMDRNLGATRADRGSGDQWREATGTLYQWGRKDPFVYEGAFNRFMYQPTVDDAVKYPTTFSGNSGDYWTSSPMDNLWNPDNKTIWDPCPPGYMVARKEAYDYMGINGWEWDYGRHFYYNGYVGGTDQAWFPNTPYLDPSGNNSWQDSQGWVRTSGPSDWTVNKQVFQFMGDGGYYSESCAADGLPVRCMKMSDRFIVQTLAPVSGETSINAKGILILNMEVEITEKGFVWSTSDTNPTTSYNDGKVTAPDTSKGSYSCLITDLQPNSTYYVRAYAIGDGETMYGEVMKVNTSSPGSGEGFTGDDFEW